MRLLVFCGTRAAIERYEMEAGWQVLVPQHSMDERKHAIVNFKSDPNGKLAIQGRMMVTGWRAPPDTQVLFDPSWPWGPGSPEWVQATMRRDMRRIWKRQTNLTDSPS